MAEVKSRPAVVNPFVSRAQFREETGASYPTQHRWRQKGLLPEPLRIGGKVGWPRSVVDAWKVAQGWPAPEQAGG